MKQMSKFNNNDLQILGCHYKMWSLKVCHITVYVWSNDLLYASEIWNLGGCELEIYFMYGISSRG